MTERTEALRESEAKLRAMFEQAAVGAAQLTTSTGCFLRVKGDREAACRISGVSPSRLYGCFYILKSQNDVRH